MKKLLLTFLVVFTCVGMAIAQDPTKVAKKKKSQVAGTAATAKKLKDKKANAEAYEKGAKKQSTTFSKEGTEK